MANVTLNPYLNFNNDTKKALNFYKDIFGGELEITRFGDMPSGGMPVAEEHKNLIMHGVLKSDSLQLMAADAAPMGGVNPGDNISISLSGDDEVTLTKYFEGLSQGATIKEPLEKAPWGDTFGMLTDKFGIGWLVNITGSKN